MPVKLKKKIHLQSQAADPSGQAITLELASDLRTMLTGSPSQVMPTDWMNQNFKHNTNPNLSYGLVQKKVCMKFHKRFTHFFSLSFMKCFHLYLIVAKQK